MKSIRHFTRVWLEEISTFALSYAYLVGILVPLLLATFIAASKYMELDFETTTVLEAVNLIGRSEAVKSMMLGRYLEFFLGDLNVFLNCWSYIVFDVLTISVVTSLYVSDSFSKDTLVMYASRPLRRTLLVLARYLANIITFSPAIFRSSIVYSFIVASGTAVHLGLFVEGVTYTIPFALMAAVLASLCVTAFISWAYLLTLTIKDKALSPIATIAVVWGINTAITTLNWTYLPEGRKLTDFSIQGCADSLFNNFVHKLSFLSSPLPLPEHALLILLVNILLPLILACLYIEKCEIR